MSALNPPLQVSDFKNYFVRDFQYGPGADTVMDIDVQKALNEASFMFNPWLFSTAPLGNPPNVMSEAKIAYLNCSAHYMWMSIQAVGGLPITVFGKTGQNSPGLAQEGEGVVNSKSAGGLSVNYDWPDFVKNNIALFQFTKSSYGITYLQMLSTRLIGNIALVAGEPGGSGNPVLGDFQQPQLGFFEP